MYDPEHVVPGGPNVLMVLMAGPSLPAVVNHSLGEAQVGLAVGQGGSAADMSFKELSSGGSIPSMQWLGRAPSP